MYIHDIVSTVGADRQARLQARLAAAKRAFTTRNVDLAAAVRMVRAGRRPQAGDVILARVTQLGQHRRIENVHGRRGALYIGDEIIVAYGNRYAPDQFEAYVPEDFGPCHLVAGGGVAARVTARHAAIKPATQIEVIGVLVEADGRALNLARFATASPARLQPARVIAVVGSSMNAGKTTTVAGLVHGLTRAGFRVGAAKLTGTGSGGDLWSMRDAGAVLAVDFTDAGHASTFGVAEEELGRITQALLARLADVEADIAVVEIADGLLQQETARLVERGHRSGWFDGFVFAAGDAMGAA
ncbi:MAG: molybdopterin-guanine dinucleotide biosynthesis protein B, partial [Erythrobacter sp.]